MRNRITVSKGFLASGWIPAVGTALKARAGTLAVFMLDPRLGGPLIRVRIGPRISVLERRSSGCWVRIFDTPTPKTARAWTGLGRHLLVEIRNHSVGAAWTWVDDRRGDKNRTHTVMDRNSHVPRVGAGKVTRGLKALPNQTSLMGWCPVSGRKLAIRSIW